MMHIDNRHRILPICIFNSKEQFLFSTKDFGTNPMYILIGNELHGYNVFEQNKPCMLVPDVRYISSESELLNLKEGEVVYSFVTNQIYQKFDDIVAPGFVFCTEKDGTLQTIVFSDFVNIPKLEVFETCQQVCDEFFIICDFETGEGKLKPISEPRFFYVKESRSLYAIVDDKKLNCIGSDISYGNIQQDGITISKSKKLFNSGVKCEVFTFQYNDMIWNVKVG